jgi:hypothetical protein
MKPCFTKIGWRNWMVFVSLFFCGISLAQINKPLNTKPIAANFGVVWNEDGDYAFLDSNVTQATALLQANVQGHAALGIRTYTFSIASGSDVMYYPTKVASNYAWRKTKYELTNESWKVRMQNGRNCIANGMDAVVVAGEEAKKNNMLFIPSLRMNDSHFMTDPYEYPLTGQFWLTHAKEYTIQNSPIAFSKDYANLLDYSHKEVRDFRLAQIKEAIDLHANLIDGFELDFNRVQVFFPKDSATAKQILITEMVQKVREMLNTLSKQKGRPMYLLVRIPPSLKACSWAGLDIITWMKKGLVDLYSPAQLMTLAGDMPIQDILVAAKKYNCLVFPSIYPRTSYRVPLVPSDTSLGMHESMGRIATLSETIAAAANYRSMGVDGFYLYNYKGGDLDEGPRPHEPFMYALVASLKQNREDAGEKVFSITKTYYNDHIEPSYAYVKQLPNQQANTGLYQLYVGEIPHGPFPLQNCILRIGVKKEGAVTPIVLLNGQPLAFTRSVNHATSIHVKNTPSDMANYSYIFNVQDLGNLRKGLNQIQVQGALFITDFELGYSYYNQLNSRMLGVKNPPINSTHF